MNAFERKFFATKPPAKPKPVDDTEQVLKRARARRAMTPTRRPRPRPAGGYIPALDDDGLWIDPKYLGIAADLSADRS